MAKNPRIPYGSIKWNVGKLHVSTPIAEVKADMARRCEKAGATPTECRLVVNYAVAQHLKNRVQYIEVTGGHLGPKTKEQRAAIKAAARRMG